MFLRFIYIRKKLFLKYVWIFEIDKYKKPKTKTIFKKKQLS